MLSVPAMPIAMPIPPALDEAPPAASNGCVYGRGQWHCHGTGYLWHEREEPGRSGRYPCPHCNMGEFLRQAKKIAEGRHPPIIACACCLASGPSGASVWLAAVETAQEVNPEAARQVLAEIGRVKVFGENASIEIFEYSGPSGPGGS